MSLFIRMFLGLVLLGSVGCVYKHPTGTTTAERRCNSLVRWDDCALAPNCIQARAWHTQDGGFKETFICIHKHSLAGKKK